MYTLIIDCSNFALKHSAHIIDNNGDIIALMYLSDTDIPDLVSQDSRISSIKLSGATEYCNGLKEEIEKKLVLEYANNKRNVEIEVI